MLALHITWSNGGLILWGELAREGAIRRRKPRVLDAETPRAAPHPRAASVGELQGAVDRWVKPPRKGRSPAATVWLPSTGGVPLPSSQLLGDGPEGGATALPPWNVPSLALTANEAVDLLAVCGDQTALAPGVIVSTDARFWSAALRFAGSLVARQRYLPGVQCVDGGWRAAWEPIFTGADADALARLAGQMPPAARAAGSEAAPPDEAAETVLDAFLGAIVDTLVRASLTPPRGKPAAFNSLHDQWMHALRTRDGAMKGDAKDLSAFARTVREWRRPITQLASAPYRLGFRLEEPEREDGSNGEDAWFLRYLLQPRDDPSLLLPLSEVWKSKGKKGAIAAQRGDPKPYVLAALGQAAGLSPQIAASLRESQPAGCSLDTVLAHAFLTETAGALEAAGFAVMLPAWWTGRSKARVSVRAHTRASKLQGGSGLTLDSLVEFDWEAALGNEPMSLGELRALARQKAPLVRVRGQWVEINAAEIQAALKFWEKKGGGGTTARDMIEMALGARGEERGVLVSGVVADGWIQDLLDSLEGRAAMEEQSIPAGFTGVLRPYQQRGYEWLGFLRRWRLGACLADDMGLGKTVQTLAFLQRQREQGERRPALLVCPTSVVANWRKESERFTPELPVMVHHGAGRLKAEAFTDAASEAGLVVSSYALMARDIGFLKDVAWSAVILDEAQNIKNAQTKQAEAARSLPADHRIALTGTPVENNVGDLWSLMEFLNPGFLGSQAAFRRRFFLPIQANGDAGAAARLQRITGPFILRRLKTDPSVISDLPSKLEMKVFASLTREQASLYEAVLRESEDKMWESDGIERRGLILGMLSRLKQVCNHPAQFLGDQSRLEGRSGKLARLSEMLEEVLAVGDRALVFTQFAQMGALLRRHVQETYGREALFLHGGVAKAARDRMVERFQTEEDGPPVFILSIKAGGTGLNLTRASHVFHYDRWWNPAVENQATDRAFRIGQTRNVQVHKFVCVGTMEERIDEMIERKKDVAERVVGTGEGWITEMSNDELKEVFSLRREAVED